jgi:hypothetical protein
MTGLAPYQAELLTEPPTPHATHLFPFDPATATLKAVCEKGSHAGKGS